MAWSEPPRPQLLLAIKLSRRLLAVILLIVGGLNWALVGLFKVDLVALTVRLE